MKRQRLCYLLLGFILAFSPSDICAKEKPMGEERLNEKLEQMTYPVKSLRNVSYKKGDGSGSSEL